MLTQLMLGFTLLGEEWVLWLLIGLSVASVAVMIERFIFFISNQLSNTTELGQKLSVGDFDFARKAVENKRGLEASVVREALNAADRGPEAVEEVVAGTIARERIRYDNWLSLLGTLGNNAPFVGLFGTVLGIIRAFHDLAATTGGMAKSNASSVMSGISGALVATAVGLAVALPAVVAFNAYGRWLKRLTASANALGHSIQSHLKSHRRDDKKAAA